MYTSQTQTDMFSNFGIILEFEKEFLESDFLGKEDLLKVLLHEKYIVKNDETKGKKPKGIVIHENVSYPKDRFVLKDGSIYQSKQITSDEWKPSEWNSRVQGQ